jgi:hypothetical protein
VPISPTNPVKLEQYPYRVVNIREQTERYYVIGGTIGERKIVGISDEKHDVGGAASGLGGFHHARVFVHRHQRLAMFGKTRNLASVQAASNIKSAPTSQGHCSASAFA